MQCHRLRTKSLYDHADLQAAARKAVDNPTVRNINEVKRRKALALDARMVLIEHQSHCGVTV
jgi:ABC-type enterochelin transport system substrate-binding protein